MREKARSKFVFAAIVAAMALFAALTASPVLADGFVIPEPPPDRPMMWRDIPLSVEYHRVRVDIADRVATTRVDQVFVNNAGFPVEGVYIFPLPEDAAISSFDMWVDGRRQEGKLLGRDEARSIYEEIVRRQRDPALLEYVGRGAFQARIFPIPAGGERRIELAYSQVLPETDGLVHYRYPLNTEKFSALPIGEVSITVLVEDKAPLRAIYSPSHDVEIIRDGRRHATIGYEAKNVLPDRDFDLYYSVSQEDVAVNVVSYRSSGEDGFFVLLVTPPLAREAKEVVAKDVILVLDTSGSMEGEKLAQARTAADYILDNLGPEDRFNIVSFSTATRLFAGAPAPAIRKPEGHAFIRKLTAQGSTDINRALLEAVSGADAARPTVVIFLTDGLPTTGETDPDRIVANISAAAPKSVRLFAFGVGDDVDTMLLDELSGEQRGTSAYVRPGQAIDEEVSGFYARVNAPVLVDTVLELSGVRIEDIYPYPLPDLFAGSQLVVVGRYAHGGDADLRLSGMVNGRPRSYTYRHLDFVERGGNEFVPRLWAQRKIGYLLTQIRLHGAGDELVDEVVALSTRFGIVTPYTSFLVEEPQMALTDAGRRQLSDALRAPTPAGDSGFGGSAGPVLAPGARSGAEAVERAVVEKELASSDQAAPPAVDQVKQVADKTFLRQAGAWIDTSFDANTMRAEQVDFGSERYFRLLGLYPEIGRYLALGDRVTVVLGGNAYAVSPTGGRPATPTPIPVRPVGK
jgi:Ca-activated chloride channel homolog